MSSLTGQTWFWPALIVIVGLPIALLVLHELWVVLSRRGSAFARPVALLRNWVLPAAAVYLPRRATDRKVMSASSGGSGELDCMRRVCTDAQRQCKFASQVCIDMHGCPCVQ